MHFGAPAPGPDVRVAFIPLPEKEVLRLARGLAKKLAEPMPDIPQAVEAKLRPTDVLKAPPLFAQIDITGYPPLHARIDRFGQTAAIVSWIHRMTVEVASGNRGGYMQAVSLYLTGLDRGADNCAISACRQMRSGTRNPLPVSEAVYQQIQSESRPLAIQIFCQSLARLDPSIRCGFLAMGAAFFGTFGLGEFGEESGESDAPP